MGMLLTYTIHKDMYMMKCGKFLRVLDFNKLDVLLVDVSG